MDYNLASPSYAFQYTVNTDASTKITRTVSALNLNRRDNDAGATPESLREFFNAVAAKLHFTIASARLITYEGYNI